jgi:NitT/TauT family transport system substrate-binding protein
MHDRHDLHDRRAPRGAAWRRLRVAALLLVVAGLLAAVGGSAATPAVAAGQATTKVRLQLAWIPKEEYAFVYAAKDKGIFAKYGIDLEILTGRGSALAMQVLNQGGADMAYVDVGEMVNSLSKGAQGLAWYGVIQSDPNQIVSWPDKPVRSIKDLAGKTVMTAATETFSIYLKYMLQANGVDPNSVTVKLVDPAAKTSSFASHLSDAVNLFQTQNIEPVEVQAKTDFVYLPASKWGANTALNATFNLVSMPDYVKANGPLLKKMAKAMAEAWTYTQKNPEAAAQVIRPMLAYAPLNQVTTVVKHTMGLGQTDYAKGKPLGWMAPQDWNQTIKNLVAAGLAPSSRAASTYYTNAYVTVEKKPAKKPTTKKPAKKKKKK